MKQIKKVTIIFLCMYFLLNINLVKAVEVPPEKFVAFYTRKVYKEICYDGKNLQIPIALCSYSGSSFPTYALTQEKCSIDIGLGFSVRTNKILKNEQVRQILLQGYPNCSFQELGCSSQEEAYLITQVAIFDTYYHYDLSKFSVTEQNQHTNILQNMISFIEKMRNIEIEEQVIELTIDEVMDQWQNEENGYESKVYRLLSNVSVKNFTIDIEVENDSDKEKIQITNINNEEQREFESAEKFKIILPEEENIEFEIIITAKVETEPIQEANVPNEEWETYFFLGTTETLKTNLLQEHTYVEILEEDLESEEEETKIEEDNKSANNKEENTIITKTYSQKQEIKELPQTGF